MKCLWCGMEFKTLEELDKHIREKHAIHYSSALTQEYLRAMKIKEEVKPQPKKEEVKKNVKSKLKKKKRR